jgi:osmoprotectant transport system substrate-binding protein
LDNRHAARLAGQCNLDEHDQNSRRGGMSILRLAVALGLVVTLLAGCSREPEPPPQDQRRPAIVVASFDFPESEILAELYGQALRGRGYPVELVDRLGPREVVEPALEQGKVDLVPEYQGTVLTFIDEGGLAPSGDPRTTHARLRQAFATRGVSVAAFAPAEDRNGFVVTGDMARRHHLQRISDLAPLASRLTFGGPPECRARPLCLQGLRDRYGLEFARFEAMPSRQVTAEALESNEIDVGMIETTDASLYKRDLVQLQDDRGLQPAENVVPVVRQQVVDRYGPALVRVLDAVSARLTTADLSGLNRLVVAADQPPSEVATGWLRDNQIS